MEKGAPCVAQMGNEQAVCVEWAWVSDSEPKPLEEVAGIFV